jgi:protein-tyrosine-phosphatase
MRIDVAGLMSNKLPSAVLFACTLNAIRSPMAAAIMHHHYGHKIYVASAGIAAGDPDPFVGIIMDEIGIDLKMHRPHSFEDLEDSAFDLLVTLSTEAKTKADDMSRTMAIEIENWSVVDPSQTQGSREQILDAYREVRDDIVKKVRQRFG